MNLDQCWSLINLSEQTRKHCFILENCCYDYYEMNALAMAQDGVFGDIIRAEGAYIHCLETFGMLTGRILLTTTRTTSTGV